MGALRTVGVIVSLLATATVVPAVAQRQAPPKRPVVPAPRPPIPRGNDLLLGSAVNGGVFAITASAPRQRFAPGRASMPQRLARSSGRDQMANR
jgi:hypothetical protein